MNVAAISRKSARNLLALFTALVAVAAASASPAAAADGSLLGCGYQPVHPFMRFLDPLPYSLLPGGDFESGAQGWKLSGGAQGRRRQRVLLRDRSARLALAAPASGQLGHEPDDVHGAPAADRPLLLDRRRTPLVPPGRGGLHGCLGTPARARPASHGTALEVVVAGTARAAAAGRGEHADAERTHLPDRAALHTARDFSSAAARGGSTTSTSTPGR